MLGKKLSCMVMLSMAIASGKIIEEANIKSSRDIASPNTLTKPS